MAKVSDQSAAEPTLGQQAAWEEAAAGLRWALDQQEAHIRAQAETIADLTQSLVQCRREREALEAELERLRALVSDVAEKFQRAGESGAAYKEFCLTFVFLLDQAEELSLALADVDTGGIGG